MWAYICTRTNLGFSVSTPSHFSSNPIQKHFNVLKKGYRYLQDTKNYKLINYNGHQDYIMLKIYVDVD